MAFKENVPFLWSTHNPEIALHMKQVVYKWKNAQTEALNRVNIFSKLIIERMPDYELDAIDLEIIQEGLVYECAMDDMSLWNERKQSVTIARGIRQKFEAKQEEFKERFETIGDPLQGSREKQDAYVLYAQKASWAISNVYRNGFVNNDAIAPAAAPYIAIMSLLRGGAPINISNLT